VIEKDNVEEEEEDDDEVGNGGRMWWRRVMEVMKQLFVEGGWRGVR
jgi:hypothetical protein